jgi:hypothetical protein
LILIFLAVRSNPKRSNVVLGGSNDDGLSLWEQDTIWRESELVNGWILQPIANFGAPVVVSSYLGRY